MSAGLARMSGKPEGQVAKFVGQMEEKYGYPSHDVRLLAEVSQAVRGKIASLGLDPKDTTSQELYYGLRVKFVADAAQIDKALGPSTERRYGSRMARAIELSKLVTGDAQVWILKPSLAKNILLGSPPKKLMNQLRYRSVASMLKHENISELYLLGAHTESNAWQGALARTTAHQASDHYTLSNIDFINLGGARLGKVAGPAEPSLSNKLTGSVAVWPNKNVINAPLITLTLMLLGGAQQLGVDIDKIALASIHPVLAWWANIDHLVSPTGPATISLNLSDVALNDLHGLSPKNSSSRHGAKALWDELADRYQSLAGEFHEFAENEVDNLLPAALAAEYQEA